MKSIICLGEKLAMLVKRYKKAAITAFILLFIFNYSAIGAALKEKDKKEILNKAYTLQIPFIENKGQIKGESVKYYAKTFGGAVFVTKDGKLVYSLPKFETKEKVKGWVIKESLVGASISNVKGEEEAVTKVSYFKGKDPSKWRRGISTYNLVSVGEVYKKIELKLKAYGKNVEKLFYVKAGANPESIKIKVEGAKSLKINEAGELEVETGLGVIKFTKPSAYQEINGKRVEVAAAYTLLSNPQYVYGFKVGSYDKKETLIIDPLLASTFIGGSSGDYGLSIALDGGGNVYIIGETYSSDYPTTPGAYNESHNRRDVFVSKLNSSLSSLLASTFIGGSNDDRGQSIALDGGGNVYITGYTHSSNYPTTSGAYDESHNGSYDVFVSKLNSSLSSLLASTFIGGGDFDYGQSIALDGGGNVYITGHTSSSDYPTTPGAYDESFNGACDVFIEIFKCAYDVFVSRLDSSLSSLLASTFIGGSGGDYGYSIALDGDGNVYITGETESSDYPTTPGAYKENYNGGACDVFVSRLDSSLSSLLASTFIGGSGGDYGRSIALDGGGNVYITGWTSFSDYPTTSGAYDESFNGAYDVFVSKLNSSLSTLLASTFIGGGSLDYGNSIALDGDRNVYIIGWTWSSNYPTTSGAYDESYNGGDYDVFVSKLDSSLSSLLASTFIGGGSLDYGNSIALDGDRNVYITGYTYSSNYPTTSGAYDESLNGDYDVFVSRLDSNLSAEMEVSGDLNGDGDVDYADFDLFLDAFGKCDGDTGYIEAADFDKDGCINCADYQQFITLLPEAETSFMSAVEYEWGDPAPGYSYADWPIFEGWMNVRVQNTGTYDAENTTATVFTVPENVEIVDGEVSLGDIAAGASSWSTDTFRIRVDMSNHVDPDEGIFWKVEYDANGEHIVEVVPEFPGTIFCAE